MDFFKFMPTDILQIILLKLNPNDLYNAIKNKYLKRATNINFAKQYIQFGNKHDLYDDACMIHLLNLDKNVFELAPYSADPNKIIFDCIKYGYLDMFKHIYDTNYNNKNYIEFISIAININSNGPVMIMHDEDLKKNRINLLKYILFNIDYYKNSKIMNIYLMKYIMTENYEIIDDIWNKAHIKLKIKSIIDYILIGNYNKEIVLYCINKLGRLDKIKNVYDVTECHDFCDMTYEMFKFIMSTDLSAIFDDKILSKLFLDNMISWIYLESEKDEIILLKENWQIIESRGYAPNCIAYVIEECDIDGVIYYMSKFIEIIGDDCVRKYLNVFDKYWADEKCWINYKKFLKNGPKIADKTIKGSRSKCINNKNKMQVIATGINFQTVLCNFNNDTYTTNCDYLKIEVIEGNFKIKAIENGYPNIIYLIDEYELNEDECVNLENIYDHENKIISGTGKFILTFCHAVMKYDYINP